MKILLPFKCLIAWAAVIIFILPILFVLIVLLTWRMVTLIYCSSFRPNFVKCYPMDRSIYCSLKNDPTHGCIFVLKGEVDTQDFFRTFLEKVVNVKDVRNLNDPHIRFFQSPIEFWGQLFLKTHENIFYGNHIHSITIPDYSSRDENIANWIAKPFKTDCPSWAILFLTVEGSDEVTLVFKFHHVLGDGYSLLHIMDLLTNTSYKYQVKDFNDTFAEKVKILFELPYQYFNYLTDMFSLGKERGFFADKLFDGHFMTTVSLPLERIKEIRRTANVHFSSVMLYLLKTAFTKYVKSTNEMVESFLIPFSLPWPNHPKTKIANQATLAVLRLQTESNTTSCFEDLMEIEDKYQAFHRKYFNRMAKWNMDVCNAFPVPILKKLSDSVGIDKNKAIGFSHMLGSENYNTLFGSIIKDVSAFGLLNSPGIWVYGLTTNNEVKLTIIGRRIPLFRPELFVECLQDSLKMFPSVEKTNRELIFDDSYV